MPSYNSLICMSSSLIALVEHQWRVDRSPKRAHHFDDVASTLAKNLEQWVSANCNAKKSGIIEKRDAQINAAQAAKNTAPLHNTTQGCTVTILYNDGVW